MDPFSATYSATTILVVDPEDAFDKSLREVLSSQYQLVITQSETLSRRIITCFPVTLIFVGSARDSKHSIDFIRELKSDHPSIPVIYYVKRPTADLLLSIFRVGARDIITDRTEPRELLDITERIVSLAGSKAIPGNPPQLASRFNLKNIWLQLRSTSPGYIKIGFPADRENDSSKSEEDLDGSASADLRTNDFRQTENAIWSSLDHPHKRRDRAWMRVFFLGRFQTMIKDRIIEEWSSKKGKSIFAYLCYHSNKPIYRDVLIDVFWPKSTPDSARNNLNVVIHGLRKRFQQLDPAREYIVFKDECYSINPEITIWSDVWELQVLWQKAQSIERRKGLNAATEFYEQIAAIYGGDFLSDEPYEDWSTLERENLREIFMVSLEIISENRFQIGNYSEAISICNAILEKDNCREEIYRRLMCCYQQVGRRDKALKAYRKCVQALRVELDVAPSAATIELYKKIKADTSFPSEAPNQYPA
jgi:DNA-binding SARP family transcriptional activator/DNA-binding NarL/FixJ family response regulator